MKTDSNFTDTGETAELYTTHESVHTSRAIADAKARFEDEYDVPRHELTARKFSSGYDDERGEHYTTIAVAIRHNAPDDVNRNV